MTLTRNIFGISVLGYASLTFCCGCGDDRPERAPVSGTVTFNGQPVTKGTITFYPSAGRSAIGKIGADGAYELTTFDAGDGAVLGEHRVTIQATNIAGPPTASSFEEELSLEKASQPVERSTIEWLVPPAYAERSTSPLTAKVQTGGNVIDFTLPQAP